MGLKFILIVDCERFVSFRQGNPRWNRYEKFKGKINNLIKNFRYNEYGFEIVYKTVLDEKFPSTFMIVGKTFNPVEGPGFIEWGYHSKDHLPLTLISDEKLKEQVKNKFRLKSFNAPMWMIEDMRNPNRIFKLLKKEGYTHCVYRGKNNGIKHFHSNYIKKPFKKEGVICVNVSNFLEGNSRKEKINEIKKEIIENLNNEGVYLLSTHDFTYKNNKNLLEIIHFVKNLEKENKLKIMKLKNLK